VFFAAADIKCSFLNTSCNVGIFVPNALIVVSKGMLAVKLCFDRILLWVLANTG